MLCTVNRGYFGWNGAILDTQKAATPAYRLCIWIHYPMESHMALQNRVSKVAPILSKIAPVYGTHLINGDQEFVNLQGSEKLLTNLKQSKLIRELAAIHEVTLLVYTLVHVFSIIDSGQPCSYSERVLVPFRAEKGNIALQHYDICECHSCHGAPKFRQCYQLGYLNNPYQAHFQLPQLEFLAL